MSERKWRFIISFMAGIALYLVVSLLFCPAASAKTVKMGDTIYITGEPQTVTVICNVSDGDGVGMGEGASIFGIKYEGEIVTTWLPEQRYEENTVLTLNVVEDKKFKILARFADSLGNWIPEAEAVETPLYLMVDENAPTGTITIKVDTVLNVSSTITIVKPSVR